MSALWDAAAVARATGGEALAPFVATGVSIDTRTLKPGDLFVALKGPTHDGHDHLADALARGAAGALVSRATGGAPGLPGVRVADTLEGLAGLGRAGRARARARVAAVTGSVGKTGVKEALRAVLGRQDATHASAASHNNHWGVPLTLARLPEAARWAVLELGMNAPGEIASLTRLARPHVALVTRIAQAHLGPLGGEVAIADAKAEIFQGLEPGGTAVLNRDDRHFARLEAAAAAAGAGVVTFGEHPESDWRLVRADLDADGSDVEVAARGRPLAYRQRPPGRHQVMNGLAVLAVVEALGGDPGLAAAALGDLRALAGRGRTVPFPVRGGTALLLDESYNANPASVRAAIELLALHEGRRVAVLGDMLELGAEGPRLHAELAGPLERAGVALVFTCGALARHLAEAVPAARRGAHRARAAELAGPLGDALRPGDVVLVKGSLGSRMADLVGPLTAGGALEAPAGAG